MDPRPGESRISNKWWTVILILVIVVFLVVTAGFFAGTFNSYVPVTLQADRSGLVMESDAKVKMRGVEIGRVHDINSGAGAAQLQLDIYPDQIRFIPANVTARIQATTAFGAKFVDLDYPTDPSTARLSAGAVLQSKNTSTEVNTVFENLTNLLDMVDPAKLNAVLTAVADGVRGQGPRMGEATTALDQVLQALNSRADTMKQDWRSFKDFNATYAAAANDIVAVLDNASTTSTTITKSSKELNSLLLNAIGVSTSGMDLLATSKDSIVGAINTLAPTTDLLMKYNPVYTCFLQGATWFLNNGGYNVWGGDGRTIQLDVALLPGNDPYMYPDNLPIVAAKGGPGGAPGCGSLPDAFKNFPVRQMITNTGYGTGLDIRPNPGLAHPCYADYLPVTRAIPKPPKIRACLPGPAPGPIPYPGAPPYGAPLYGPGGVPLWSGVPPADPAIQAGDPVPPATSVASNAVPPVPVPPEVPAP
ncbi:MAG: phospholipid/cholesterol/gamma-HCH transport system substrate-binding protein [Mycobacterium sp.]|jgi:phospholipid/cholesterol/gamma-HCH transport system substrate-binding protein|nr:phospholipid/cholesterol/gamma-HCH transport system substrate-binding protein [Mycobacterium sp.]